jgi:oxygen-dependent protoporphyrinogen oxidase
MPGYDVVVVGGGVAGLISGLRYARSGYKTVILEAEAEPGGCVRLHDVGGLRLDRGAESFATSRPAVARLITELGLAVERPTGGAAWVHHPGGQAPIPAATLLGIPAHPAAGDVRRVIGWAGAARAELDRVLPRGARRCISDDGPPPSLGAVVRRRMGRRVLTRLVQPVAGGVYSIDPDELDIAAVAPDLAAGLAAGRTLAGAVAAVRGSGPAAGSAVAGVVGGMGLVTEALSAAFVAAGGTLRCGIRVQAVVRRGGDWQVSADAEAGVGENCTAPAVVLAVPGAVAAPLIARATDDAARLPVAPASRVRLVTLLVDAPQLDSAPRGSGLLVAPGVTDVAAKALTHATAKWRWLAEQAGRHRHVLRLSYGRGGESRDGDMRAGGSGGIVDLALRDAGRLLGVPLARRDLQAHAVVDFNGQLSASRAAQAAERARFQQRIASITGLSVVGAAIAGTGLSAVVANATAAPLVEPGRERAGSKYDES